MSSLQEKQKGQFLTARGVMQGCPASGLLFVMTFDPIFWWFAKRGHTQGSVAP